MRRRQRREGEPAEPKLSRSGYGSNCGAPWARREFDLLRRVQEPLGRRDLVRLLRRRTAPDPEKVRGQTKAEVREKLKALQADRVRRAGHPPGRALPGPAGPPVQRHRHPPLRHRQPAQYTSVHFAETLLLAGLVPSIGTVGDALDNALAETTVGLYKTECVRQDSPFRTGPITGLAELEGCTSARVHWYNTSRLMHRLGRRPPAEAEAQYYAAHGSGLQADDLHT